jgi:Cu+-exporting ATPase
MALKTEAKSVCYHCGDSCGTNNFSIDDKNFCCNGCKTVYELLSSNNLCDYYTIDDKAGLKNNIPLQKGKFAFLDATEIQNQLLQFQDNNQAKINFFIPAMHCSSCVWLLEKLYNLLPGIIDSRVNFDKKQLHLTFNPTEINLRQIVEKLCEIGYEPAINLSDTKQGIQTKQARKLAFKLGVAGFCMGNIMLFSFPEYLGMDKQAEYELARTFSWLNLVLALPVFFYSASGFFQSAFQGLKAKTLNIDFPLALGIFSLFTRSAYEIISNTGSGFFDSMAALVFFLLIGRWLQDRAYTSLSFERDYESYFPVAAVKVENNKEVYVPIKNIAVGDYLRIRNHELIPADSILIKGLAKLDYSFVTGESKPVEKKTGDSLFAGGRQKGEVIEVLVQKPVQQSYLTGLWNQHEKTESQVENFSQIIGKYFTYAILLFAIATLVYWIPKDIRIAMNAFTAVLIVACPCVLVVSAPFAFGNVMTLLGRFGFYLKNPQIVEKLASIDTVVFDKTGTITESKPSLKLQNFGLSDNDLLVIQTMCKNSGHPLSKEIATMLAATAQNQVLNLEDFQEIGGKGLAATYRNHHYKVGSASFTGVAKGNALVQVYVAVDGKVEAVFEGKHTYRQDMNQTLNALKTQFSLHLLSGDNDAEKPFLVNYFQPEAMRFSCSPEQKKDYIHHLSSHNFKVLMVGDGLNDAIALKESFSGIAITDDINCFTPASDVIMEGKHFSRLPAILTFCKNAMKLVKSSFLFSLIYNSIWMVFAMRGDLMPIIAALLMPLSSITVFTINTIGIRYYAKKNKLNV